MSFEILKGGFCKDSAESARKILMIPQNPQNRKENLFKDSSDFIESNHNMDCHDLTSVKSRNDENVAIPRPLTVFARLYKKPKQSISYANSNKTIEAKINIFKP